MLQVDGLSVSYGAVRALHDVSLGASEGEITAVLGANGAGKTSLLRSVSGLVHPRAGSITFDGMSLRGLQVEAIARRRVAHVPEGRGVIEQLTVEENLRLGLLWAVGRRERREALEEIYELFPPLEPRKHRQASTLSGGERQMLAIGRALVSRPRLLLLDEPSLGLAPIVTAQLMAVLHDLVQQSKLTVVLVEQNARSALSVSHRAVVLNLGEVVVDGLADEVAADRDLRRHYLGF